MQKYVGIGEMLLTDNEEDILVAPNLGSCIAVAAFNPETRMSGLIHCLLPASKSDPEKAKANPTLYVDTGVTLFLQKMLGIKTDKRKLVIAIAGGASMGMDSAVFEIGKKNTTVVRQVMWKNGLLLRGEDVGGGSSRTVRIEAKNGRMVLKTQGNETIFFEGM